MAATRTHTRAFRIAGELSTARTGADAASSLGQRVQALQCCVVPRFKLTVEYAGTRYSGWQIQRNAKTVQGHLDQAVRAVTGRQDFELYGAGRTDAGVHAAGQVAHLDVSTSLAAHTLRQRLNGELPSDINIVDATIVPHRFHARHDA